jgi:DNA-binding MarR family transcriptional regulator
MLNKMSNASRLVEKLKAKDLVKREECPSDRRQVDILITEKGLSLLEVLEKQVEASHQTAVHLTEQEANLLNELLDKLRG